MSEVVYRFRQNHYESKGAESLHPVEPIPRPEYLWAFDHTAQHRGVILHAHYHHPQILNLLLPLDLDFLTPTEPQHINQRPYFNLVGSLLPIQHSLIPRLYPLSHHPCRVHDMDLFTVNRKRHSVVSLESKVVCLSLS